MDHLRYNFQAFHPYFSLAISIAIELQSYYSIVRTEISIGLLMFFGAYFCQLCFFLKAFVNLLAHQLVDLIFQQKYSYGDTAFRSYLLLTRKSSSGEHSRMRWRCTFYFTCICTGHVPKFFLNACWPCHCRPFVNHGWNNL